ncbi:DNA repair protein SWI5 homolog [Meriones unguiculatus]|uniref:DNA repair protein SWI5 homolog n=1 Tax=Meriones unguiculatus TaxID=10047 RepID=UPI00293F7645|nr:DNA repair protein SWI5 homolog [Meriones unguiculatus]
MAQQLHIEIENLGERLVVSVADFSLPGYLRQLFNLNPGRSEKRPFPIRPSPKAAQADEIREESDSDLQKLKEKQGRLDREMTRLAADGYWVMALEDHLSLLHEYKDVKDVAQMLLGKLAVIRGVTTKDLY